MGVQGRQLGGFGEVTDSFVATYDEAVPSLVYYLRRQVQQFFEEDRFIALVRSERPVFAVLSRENYAAMAGQLASTCVIERRPTFDVKLRNVLAREPLPELVLPGTVTATSDPATAAAGADLVISLHVEAHPNPLASGVATYYYGNDRYGHYSSMGARFAGLVQREICARTDLLDCRTHPMNWDLLRRTRMPAVRIEAGYLTNPGDAARLADPAFRDVLAEAIVAAVQRLYLPPDQDAETGFLRIPALRV